MINWIKRKISEVLHWFFKREDVPIANREPLLLPLTNKPGWYVFYCPGCEDNHTIFAGAGGHTLKGSNFNPTIKPSVLYESKNHDIRCHAWVTNGRIRFLHDCTHRLAGKTVNLIPL
jgi:hypothetical protein